MERPLRLFARDRAEFDRGLGFFDAIYGFAITLLIANVDLPPAEAWDTPATLLAHGVGEQLLGFVISFVVIAVFWKRNTELLARYTALDGPVITANLVTAGFVVLLPFTTQGISEPGLTDLPLPTALYAANVALAMLSLAVMHEIGSHRGLVAGTQSPALRRAVRVDVTAKMSVFIASIPVAYLAGADWGKITWLVLVIVGPLTGRWTERLDARG